MKQTHEAFKARPQLQLQSPSFNPTEQQISFARLSLIEKAKVLTYDQQLLFCKVADSELFSLSEKALEDARKKYVEFIRKNYNQKLSDELFSVNKLRNRVKEFERAQREKQAEDDEETVFKRPQPTASKKRTKEPKITPGKKKVKQEQPKKKEEAVVAAGEGEAELQELQVPDNPSEASESIQLNLINSLSQDEFQGDYDE